MHQPINARALGNAIPKNLNTSLVDANRYLLARSQADALALAIQGMKERGELDIARGVYAEFCKARQEARNLKVVAGITEEDGI